jgi:hypothetical protein
MDLGEQVSNGERPMTVDFAQAKNVPKLTRRNRDGSRGGEAIENWKSNEVYDCSEI